MVTVGIVGLGPAWETRFRPALEKLRKRIAVAAIYDLVASRAEQVAGQLGAVAVDGVSALSERADLRAFLLLDSGWHGWESLRILCRQRKPVFIASGFGRDFSTLRALHLQAAADGQPLMPGLGARYTPATCRLRELMATRLGLPQTIQIDASFPEPESVPLRFSASAGEALLSLLDWCQYVVGAAPSRVLTQPLNGSAESGHADCSLFDSTAVTIEFADQQTPAAAATIRLRIHRRVEPDAADAPWGESLFFDRTAQSRIEVVCQRGTAEITSTTEITWNNGEEAAGERLSLERSAVEVMLDLFCRRVAGGLIPLVDVSDVLQSARLIEAAQQSLRSGDPVLLGS